MADQTFDGDNQLVVIDFGKNTVDLQREIYSAWKRWMLSDPDAPKYFAPFRVTGGDELVVGIKFLSGYFFLINGWRIKPYEADHELSFTNGYLFVDGGGNPVVPTTGGFRVTVTRDTPADAFQIASDQQQLTNIENDIDQIQTDVSAIQTDIGAINTSLSSINGSIGTINTNIGTINATLTSIDGRLTSIEGDIGDIQTSVGLIQGDITTIEGRLTTIEGNITSIDGSISAIDGNIVTINTNIGTIQTDIADLKVAQQFMADIEGGRWRIDVAGFQMIFYKPDNSTEVARFDLFDELGTPTADPARIAERRRV